MQIIGEIAVGVIVGLASALVSTRLALRRYRSERWWDKKYDAYLSILNALHAFLSNLEASYSEIMSDKEIPEDEQKERNRRYKEGIDQIDRHITLGTFVLQKQAVDALEALKKSLIAAKREQYFEYLDASEYAYREALTKIRDSAIDELSDLHSRYTL